MENYRAKNMTPQQIAEDLASKMTVEEKAGQLRYDACRWNALICRGITGGTRPCMV